MGQAVFGSIIGTVTDPQGNAVVGAKVTVTSVTKSFTFDTTTNESGNYSVTHLIPDTYKVRVEATGFSVSQIPSVGVSADTAASVNVQLQVGAVTQSVEVTGEIPQLQTDRADVDIQFNQQYIQDLPVLNRNFTKPSGASPAPAPAGNAGPCHPIQAGHGSAHRRTTRHDQEAGHERDAPEPATGPARPPAATR